MHKIRPDDFYKSNRSPYYIYGFNYNELSSGVRVLHLLCHLLNNFGYEAYIRANVTSPDLWTPVLNENVIRAHYQQGRKPIVIYPETIPGQPLELGVVVRYLLNKPGYIGGQASFGKDETIFAYQKMFVEDIDIDGFLMIPACDITKFNSNGVDDSLRKGSYFYYNRLPLKGGRLQSITENSIEISPRVPRTLNELADIFRSAEKLYSYEYSAIAVEAQLCGCPVVYVPNQEMLPEFPYGQFGYDGAAWGDSADEFVRAKSTVGRVYEEYLKYYDISNRQLLDFVNFTQSKARSVKFEDCFSRYSSAITSCGVDGVRSSHSAVESISRVSDVLDPSNNELGVLVVLIFSVAGGALLDETITSVKSSYPNGKLNIEVITSAGDFSNFVRKSTSDWIILLCEGDRLTNDASVHLMYAIRWAGIRGSSLVYFDHNEIDNFGQLGSPSFKPDFNYDYLLSFPYIGRGLLFKKECIDIEFLGSCRFDLTFSYKLALREAVTNPDGLLRYPEIIINAAKEFPFSIACTSELWQSLAMELEQFLQSKHPGSHVLEGPAPGTFHVIYPLSHTPKVSIVVPTRDQLPFLSRCIESLLEKTDYPDYEIIVVDNDSQTPEALTFLSGLEQVNPDLIRVIRVPGPFNFSRMNNLAVAQARGEFILLLNNDTAVLQADWLSHMMRHALRDGVGIVGARLVYPEGTVQHAGVIMGLRGPADHPFLGLKPDEPGYMFRAQLTQNFSAVTAACMLVSKAVYDEVGGLDEVDFAVSYNDIDFCLKVGQTGRRIVWTPLATLLHEGSASQKASIEDISHAHKVARFTKEQAAMYRKWPEVIANDPAYNPNLSLAERGYEVETNPLLCFDPLRDFYEHKVVAFAADVMGCGHYRILQPMQAMLQDDLCLGGASPEIFGPNLALRSRADVLVFQRPNDDRGIQTLEALIPLKGIKKIYEVDDNLTRVPVKSAHFAHMPKDMRGRMLKSIGLCDRLIVSTEPLAQDFRNANGDVRVVPNRLPPAMWGGAPPKRDPQARRGRKPVVAWAGGVGHRGDLEMIEQVIKDLADEVDWEFFGMCPDSLKPYVKIVHNGVPTLEYPARLIDLSKNWDLAIAPLEVNAFNESKSNLRLLEYGWCGLPVVCSDVTPYQDKAFPVRRVKNRHKDWKAAILEKLGDPDAAHREGQALQDLVAKDWVLRGQHVIDWCKAWTD